MEVDDVSNSFELPHDCLSKSGRTLTIQQRQGVWGLPVGALLTHSVLQKYKKISAFAAEKHVSREESK